MSSYLGEYRPTHSELRDIEEAEEEDGSGVDKCRAGILQAENYQNFPTDEPNYINIESPPSMHPPLRICDITGFEVCASVEMCLVLELAGEIHHYF
ncbi:hypothetical protein OIU76_020747 [Salix suchowensis]|nr:hypothetical protein OIU76_020747 [Salix suchowensis]